MRELADAEGDYLKAHNYMTGDVPEFFASRRIARRIEKTGTSFRINVAKTAVEAVSDRLEIAAVTVPDNETLSRILQTQVIDANEMMLEMPLVHDRACEYGDAY